MVPPRLKENISPNLPSHRPSKKQVINSLNLHHTKRTPHVSMLNLSFVFSLCIMMNHIRSSAHGGATPLYTLQLATPSPEKEETNFATCIEKDFTL